jgi:DNA-binding response OmpR family regulator
MYTGDLSGAPGAHTVLVVDDEEGIASIVAYAFRLHGYQTLVATDVAEARALYAMNTVDLVVLDWYLPEEPGVVFLEELHSEGGPPVIVISGSIGSAIRNQAYDAGAVDFIAKPFRIEVLLESGKAAIEGVPTAHGGSLYRRAAAVC